MDNQPLHPELIANLRAQGVDLDRLTRFLEDLNAGKFGNAPSGGPYSFPPANHPAVVDISRGASFELPERIARERAASLGVDLDRLVHPARMREGAALFDAESLREVGMRLYPKAAFGVLNGGAATSYVDFKKNRALAEGLFDQYADRFTASSELYRHQPKGIAPAYFNEDGSSGESFLFLKLRMLARARLDCARLTGFPATEALPFFQMTSVHTDAAVAEALRSYSGRPDMEELARATGSDPCASLTACQTMMAAITHSGEGSPRRVFDRAWGKEHSPLAMPGGHGQNFEVLASVYRELYTRGIRFVWLGNIDNLGFTVDPVSLATLALGGNDASFEFSARTPMDVKGGVLVSDAAGRFTCADIGPAIGMEEVLSFERSGGRVFFNCGLGLFNLARLIELLDELPYRLPLRITDQDKDAGRYAQAEQITWEIIGLLDDPLFLVVDKRKRFLAAKMLMETLLTSLPPPDGSGGSATGADSLSAGAGGPTGGDGGSTDVAAVSRSLHEGLVSLLEGEYAMRRDGPRWVMADH